MPVSRQAIRTVHSCANPSYVLVLVHGTWAKSAVWTGPGSALVRYLLAELGSEAVAIYALDWSGRNSVKARDSAALALEIDLKDLLDRFPEAIINIVAHSHGGNVAAKAVANMGIDEIGLACLSTPFLRVHKRKAGAWSAKLIVVALSFFLFQTILLATPFAQTFSHFGRKHHEIVGLMGFYVAYGIWMSRKNLPPRISTGLKEAAVRFSSSVNFRIQPSTRFLIVRMSDDEAGVALSAYRFLDWILETYIASVRRAWVILKMSMQRRTGMKYKGMQAPRWPKVSYLGTIIVWATLSVWLYLVYRGSEHPVLYIVGFYYLVFLLVVCSLTLVLCLTAVFAVVPLGWSAVLGIFSETVSIDWTPPGAWKLNLVEPSGLGLRHSQPYANQYCLSLLGAWIAKKTVEQALSTDA